MTLQLLGIDFTSAPRRAKPITADFTGLKLPDRYVFGYGMDYYEQGRNLPDIYALKD